MSPANEQTPAEGPKVAGFDRARMPKPVSMRDPSMGGRRKRNREGRERKRARESRRKVLIFTGGGMVFLTLIGMTVLNVLERNREAAAAKSGEGKGEKKAAVVSEADSAGAAKPAAKKASDYAPSTHLEKARDRYLQRSVGEGAGSEDAKAGAKGLEESKGSDESAARAGGGAEEASEADKERVLRQVLPYYRSAKKRDAPAVPADQLYIPDPSEKKPKIGE